MFQAVGLASAMYYFASSRLCQMSEIDITSRFALEVKQNELREVVKLELLE